MAIEKANKTAAAAAGGEQPSATERGESRGPQFSLGQRFSVGLNVGVAVVAAAGLLVAANWIASVNPMQRDLSSMGRYSLSQRTTNILSSIDEPVRISVLYSSQDPKKIKDEGSGVEFKPRLLELLGEIRSAGRDVKIIDVATLDDRLELARRLEKAQADDARQHIELISQFLTRHKEWIGQIDKAREDVRRSLARDTWVSGFISPQVAHLQLMELSGKLKLQAERLEELGKQRAGMLTAFDDQADLLKTAMAETVGILEDGAVKPIRQLGDLYRKLTGEDDGGLSANTRKHAAEFTHELKALIAQLDAWKARPPTTQPAGVLAGHFERLAKPLGQQRELLRQFVNDQPAMTMTRAFMIALGNRGMTMQEAFNQFHLAIQQTGLEMRQAELGPEFATFVADWSERLEGVGILVLQVFDELNRRLATLKTGDEPSASLLGGSEQFLADVLTETKAMQDKLNKLPKLKLRGLAGKFEQDNLLLLEVGNRPLVALDFDTVWPQLVPPSATGRVQVLSRTFNGDSAIGSALFAMAHPQLAEVVFVHFATAMPQMNPMMMQQMPRRQEGPIPHSELSVLRDRLEQANLKVSEWNLADSETPPLPAYSGQDDGQQPANEPKGDPLPRVYLVLPPPPQNPYMPGPGLEDKHRDALAKAIGEDGRAIFLSLCTYGEDGWFNDGWGDYLKREWGVELRNAMIIHGIPSGKPGELNINRNRLSHMLVNQFDPRHPVGKALNNRRILLVAAAPVRVWMPTTMTALADYLELDDRQKSQAAELTKGYEARMEEVRKRHGDELKDLSWDAQDKVRQRHELELDKLESELQAGLRDVLTAQQKARLPRPLLQIPDGDNRFFATSDIERVVKQFHGPGDAAVMVGPTDLSAPLAVMVESTRKSPTGRHSRVIVFSAGISFVNGYLTGRVERETDEGISREPAPSGNSDIITNSVYHLVSQAKWIAPGPTIVPPITVARERVLPIQVMVIGGLPLAALVICGAVMMLRRRS